MSVTQKIAQLIDQDLFLKRGVANKVVNLRALAKFLKKKHFLTFSEEAIVSAIRRYEPNLEADEAQEDIFPKAMYFVKNNVCCLTTTILDPEKISQILIDENLNRNIRVVRGKKYTKFIAYGKESDDLKSHFLEDDIVNFQANLVEIRLMLDRDVQSMVGVLSGLTASIAAYKVPLQEVIVSVPEILLYVREEHSLNTQKALMELIGKKA